MKRSRLIAVASIAGIVLLLTVSAVFAFPYLVQPGDTLWELSRRYGTTIDAIVQANPGKITNPNLIYSGDTIEIPSDQTPAPPQPTATPGGSTVTPAPTSVPTTPAPGGTYTVQYGDTLYKIAAKFNTTVSAILAVNPQITNPNLIYPGQVINLPGGSGGLPTPTAPAGPTPTAGPVTPVPTPSGDFGLGGQTQTLGNPGAMKESGMTWVKFQYKWSPGDSTDAVADMISAGHDQGFKVLISLTGANTYPPAGGIDFAGFTNFVGEVARLGPDAIEIWNEMNIDFEWPAGEINPTSYVNNMLAPAYQAAKANNPNVLIITGAPAPTGFDNTTNAWADDRYIQGMAAAGATNYADCIGVHYNAGATSPSQVTGHPAGPSSGEHYSWYYLPMRDLYYNAFGGAKKLCFTELGYLSGDGFPGLPAGFSWASGTSVQEQAAWLTEARDLSRSSGQVLMMIVFNVDFTQYDINGDPQAGYAMLRPDGSCPACDALGQ